MGERPGKKRWPYEGYGRDRLDDQQEPNRSEEEDDGSEDREELDLEETLDRERHGSGEYEPEERYGRRDVFPDRENAGPGDEDKPDTAEGEPKRGRLPRKQDPE